MPSQKMSESATTSSKAPDHGPSFWQPSLNHWLMMLVEKHKSPCRQGDWGKQVVEFRSNQSMAGLEMALRMSGRDLLVNKQLRCLLEAFPMAQWKSLGRGYLRVKSIIIEGKGVLKRLNAAFSEMQTLLGRLMEKDERPVPDFDGTFRDWEDWLATREGIAEVEIMEEMLELLVKAFKKLAVTEGHEYAAIALPNLLHHFGREWVAIGQLPPPPPLSSPCSLLSRRTSLYHSVSNRGVGEIDGVKTLPLKLEKCGHDEQFCEEGEVEKLYQVVVADEMETASFESGGDCDEISPYDPDFPPLAASTPLASLRGLDINLSLGSEDSSSSGSDWLLGDDE